jgi:ubiquinone/menaquinone biosynthesis C-methylase UbiE
MTMKPEPGTTVETVRAFWQSHVNNEYYTDAARASQPYFDEIEAQRYQTHYHLPELYDSLHGDGSKLLEIGCGIGVDSIQLARRGFEVTAVDLTENALQIAEVHAETRGVAIDFRLGNAEGLEFPDETFDVVYSFGVLHHTPDIKRSVAEVHRVLRQGGTAYIMLYHRYSLVNLVHRLLRIPYESPRNRHDHCPVVYTVSRREVRRLFHEFSSVSVHAAYPFTFGFGPLATRLPLPARRGLGRLVGWHLMIDAVR